MSEFKIRFLSNIKIIIPITLTIAVATTAGVVMLNKPNGDTPKQNNTNTQIDTNIKDDDTKIKEDSSTDLDTKKDDNIKSNVTDDTNNNSNIQNKDNKSNAGSNTNAGSNANTGSNTNTESNANTGSNTNTESNANTGSNTNTTIPELIVTPQIIENSSCINSNCIYSITGSVSVSGGTGTYTYTLRLREPAGVSKEVHTNSVAFSGSSLYDGTYTLNYEVKDSNGTTKTGTKTYELKKKPIESGEPLTASARITTQRTCKGSNCTEQVVLSIQHSGGSKPYKVEYTLYRDGNVVARTGAPLEKNVNATTLFLNFVAGNYTSTYTVTDANGKTMSGETYATFETCC